MAAKTGNFARYAEDGSLVRWHGCMAQRLITDPTGETRRQVPVSCAEPVTPGETCPHEGSGNHFYPF